MRVKTLGIIGGLGPMATAHLLQLVIEMTDAKTDQEHLDVIVFDRPNVPDRTAYLLDRTKPSPLPSMTQTAKTLESLGAGVLCAPCVTSHYFYQELAGSVNVPFLNMVTETAAELKAAGCKKAGIMATTGTVRTGLFQTAFTAAGLESAIPDEAGQALVMSLIYDDVKSGRPGDPDKFERTMDELLEKGCDVVLLACTEISFFKKTYKVPDICLDALDVLVRESILRSGAEYIG